MNNFYVLHELPLQGIQMLVAVGTVWMMARIWRQKPDGPIARLLRHRDKVWLALAVLLVSDLVLRYASLHWVLLPMMRHPSIRPELFIANYGLSLVHGMAYGVAGSLFASPKRKGKQFSFGMASVVAVVLIFLVFGALPIFWRRR